MSSESIFSEIYLKRRWGKNVPLSGEGSSPSAVDPYLEFLLDFLDQHKEIQVILDIGHGDWEMWPEGFFKDYQYFGVDVVSHLSNEMNLVHGNEKTQFLSGDFLEIELPNSDVLLIKDVLIHLSNSDISRAIRVFSKYRYVIVTTDILSSGIRVFLACLIRLVSKAKWKKIIQSKGRPEKIIEFALESDIQTGSYHWVKLNDTFLRNENTNLQIKSVHNYEVSGITLGRKVIKQIVILGI